MNRDNIEGLSLRLSKAENGWTVSYEIDMENLGDSTFKRYVYEYLSDAMKKFNEIADLLKGNTL